MQLTATQAASWRRTTRKKAEADYGGEVEWAPHQLVTADHLTSPHALAAAEGAAVARGAGASGSSKERGVWAIADEEQEDTASIEGDDWSVPPSEAQPSEHV